ncbi:hypothetical protein [Bacteroides cellulosilyticus]|uniref:hypothetical protein n=1 Tax=Bacteroides cellulosilyticus TaxID=246787 RepID=UPI0035622A5B
MNRQNRIENRGDRRATDRRSTGRKEHFSRNFVPEYLEVPKNRVHTFSPPVTRALIYLFSVSP